MENNEYNLEQGYIIEPDGVQIPEPICIDQTEKFGRIFSYVIQSFRKDLRMYLNGKIFYFVFLYSPKYIPS